MKTCISLPYSNRRKTDAMTLAKLFYLANKQHTILALEEARELWAILKTRIKRLSISDAIFGEKLNEICYEFSLGRNMYYDEEIELLARPNQILIDK
jgi:hypothetical protein